MTIVTFILVVVGCFIYFGIEAATKKAKETSTKLDKAWDSFWAHPIVRGFLLFGFLVLCSIIIIIFKNW